MLPSIPRDLNCRAANIVSFSKLVVYAATLTELASSISSPIMGSSHSGRDSIESCKPAPYGCACLACSRAKCKCFRRADGSGCERCHRLGKKCEPSTTVRKRKVRDCSPPTPRSSPVCQGQLEQRLNDLTALLRTQAPATERQVASSSPSACVTTPSTSNSTASAPVLNPDLVLDTVESFIDLLRPPESQHSEDTASSTSPIFLDVSVHHLPASDAEKRLNTFRRAFLPSFPCIHLPPTIKPAELFHQKPFMWLVIMSLTDRVVARQFAMEATIWKIISHRIVTQHHADLDSLLAIMCFSNWSHYYKQEKPFMNMLTQLALTMAAELELDKEGSSSYVQGPRYGRVSTRSGTKTTTRTLEERRAYLALVKLSSTTWEAYRKIRPVAWSPYVGTCLDALERAQACRLDISLAAQINCLLVINPVLCPPLEEITTGHKSQVISMSLLSALLRRLNEIRGRLPPGMLSDYSLRLSLDTAELKLRDRFLSTASDGRHTRDPIQRIQDLESTLNCAEKCLNVVYEIPIHDWPGISVDQFAQYMHCFVVLFKLTTLEDPLWSRDDVRKRVDVLDMLDQSSQIMSRVATELQMVDCERPRSGLFFKGPGLMKAIKALMASEMKSKTPTITNEVAVATTVDIALELTSEADQENPFLLNLDSEPWLSDIFIDSWGFDLETATMYA